MTDAIVKQGQLIDSIKNLFKWQIISQEESGDYIIFTTETNELVSNDVAMISGVSGASDYNSTFEIAEIISSTQFKIAKSNLTYNASADFTSAYIASVTVWNNAEVNFSILNYPAVVLSIGDTDIKIISAGTFLEMETEYPLFIVGRHAHFEVDDETQINSERAFIQEKMYKILNDLEFKIVSEIRR